MRPNRSPIPIIALVVWVAAPTVEASAQVEVDTTAIELRGRLPLASGVSRSFRVTLLDTSPVETATIEILAGDLIEVDGPSGSFIDRSHVSLTAPQLRKGVPANATITVREVEHPGTFNGRAVLRVPGHPEGTSDTIDITVKVLPSIALQFHVPSAGYQRVSCRSRLSCAVGSRLVHDAAVDSLFRILITNSAQDSIPLRRLRITQVGQSSGQPYTPVDSIINRALPVGPEVLTVLLPRTQLPAGHYDGEIRADIQDAGAVLASIAFDVRLGPIWMLTVLFTGILVSRLLTKINKTRDNTAAPSASNGIVARVLRALSGFSWEHRRPDFAVGLLAVLSGLPWATDQKGRKYLEFVARAVTIIVLLIAAVSKGVETLYVGNATFGEKPILAYTSVFLWPFVAEVVTRGLGNLKWPN